MTSFPFRALFLCIFLPSVCYVLSLQTLEGYLQRRESVRLHQILVRNYEALYEGRYSLKEEIARNLEEYLKRSLGHRLGIRLDILVKTRDNRVLYPSQLGRDLRDADEEGSYSKPSAESLNYVEVAAENYRIINEGLDLGVEVRIRHNGWLSNGVLILYVFLSVFILQSRIRKGLREVERKGREQRELSERLSTQLAEAESRLEDVKSREAQYKESIGQLARDKGNLSRDIDGLLEEMENLEAGLTEQSRLREASEQDVQRLKQDLDKLKDRVPRPKQRRKKLENAGKRFKVLYKNLLFTERAVEGFLDLTEEFQLKAEELIHRLNSDESSVPLRRKVFGKGGKTNVLEAEFSYSGRIYFQKESQGKIRVITIGTKNTQDQDLAFIESLR
jgi:hypothetical protein